MRRLRVGLAGLGVAALVFSAGSIAAAKPSGPGFQTQSRTIDVVGAGIVGIATATCPKGNRAVSGGYNTTPRPTTTGVAPRIPIVFESHRSGVRSWVVSVANSGAGTTTLTAFVYCRPQKLKEVAVSEPLSPAPRSQATATATCPKGLSVVSGGFRTPGSLTGTGSLVYVTDLEPSGARSWTVTAARTAVAGQGGDAPVTSYAYCGKASGGGLKSKTVSVATSPGNVYLSATTSTCPKSQRATGGAFRAPYTQNGPIRESTFVTRLERNGRSWRAFGVAAGTTGLTLDLTAIALCR